MPENIVSDPVTDQKTAFAHPGLSGIMTGRRAADEESMTNHQAQVPRNLNLGRDQILTRLWELANLSPEATRNNIAGQIKALAMIVAIEGLIPDRRLAIPRNQPEVPPPFNPNFYRAAWLREQQPQAEGAIPGQARPNAEAPPVEPQPPTPQTNPEPALNHERNQAGPFDPFIHTERTSWVPDATGSIFAAAPEKERRLPFAPLKGFSGRRRR